MTNTLRRLAFALVALGVAGNVFAASKNQVVMGFGVDVTATAQAVLIEDKVPSDPATPAAGPPIPVTRCDAWIIENDDDTDTVWIKWAVPGGRDQPPVAQADPGDTVPNQMRLKPNQVKSLTNFSNSYFSIIGTGAAHVHFECHGPR